MRCESCCGTGLRIEKVGTRPVVRYPQLPCRDCGGSGIAYCCEGPCFTSDDNSFFPRKTDG